MSISIDPEESTTVDMKISDDSKIQRYERGVTAVLYAIGHSEALVTDLSSVSDFYIGLPESCEKELNIHEDLRNLMKRSVAGNEFIWELAKELKMDPQLN